MYTFTANYLTQRLIISPDILRIVGQIREYKGKQALYAERKPEVLENLRRVAFIESVESSNRLEHIETDRKSLQNIVQRREEPQSRPQTELAGYRDVLESIHQNHSGMRFSPSLVQQLHRDLLQYTPTPGGNFKNSPNDIVEKNEQGEIIRVRFRTVQPYLTPSAMNQLHDGFRGALQNHDPLILIPNYVHDFLCIHPFADGNGRMARLLTVLLLYQHGFEVPRYVSLEKLIEDTKESYYETLNIADRNWNEGTHDHRPFTEYMLGIVLGAYRLLEGDIERVQTGRGHKTSLVLQAVEALPAVFSIADVENRCPSVGRDTIRNVLQRLASEGRIRNVSKGRSAKWNKMGY